MAYESRPQRRRYLGNVIERSQESAEAILATLAASGSFQKWFRIGEPTALVDIRFIERGVLVQYFGKHSKGIWGSSDVYDPAEFHSLMEELRGEKQQTATDDEGGSE
jgi:hypothetical protein